MANIDFDVSDLERGLGELNDSIQKKVRKAIQDVASEVIHLSSFEVPIETGNLQNSGHIDSGDPDDVIVGYNTIYAAYQHEGMRKDGSHVVVNYSNPRSKKKFLEDPIRNNSKTFISYYMNLL